MNEIIISSPAEVVGIPEDEHNVAIVRFGHLFSFEKYIERVCKLVPLIKSEPYYIMFEGKSKGKADYVTGKIEEIDIYNDYYYHPSRPEASYFLISTLEEDYHKLTRMYINSRCKSSTITRFRKTWKTMEIWNFNGVILKQENETLEDLRSVGIGLLTLFRQSFEVEKEMSKLWW